MGFFKSMMLFYSSRDWVIKNFKIVPEHIILCCCTVRIVTAASLKSCFGFPKKVCLHCGELFPYISLKKDEIPCYSLVRTGFSCGSILTLSGYGKA